MSNGRLFPIVDFKETNFLTHKQRQEIVRGFGQFFVEKAKMGWRPFLMTFQFNQLPGNPGLIIRQMKDHVSKFHGKFVSSIQRFPSTPMGRRNVPILIGCADLPIAKAKKRSLPEISINDGVHLHGIRALPPLTRVCDLQSHLSKKGHFYESAPLLPIRSDRIENDIPRVVAYAFKAFSSGRIGYDEAVLVLPRAFSELK